MPNIASVLKSEVSRVARRELRGPIHALKKTVVGQRADIAALKRRTKALEQLVRQLTRGAAKGAPVADAEVSSGPGRFSAKSLASQRRRLGLSAEDCGLLVGVSSQSIYNWEQGKARPRANHLPALSALRTLSKKTATAHLDSLKSAG